MLWPGVGSGALGFGGGFKFPTGLSTDKSAKILVGLGPTTLKAFTINHPGWGWMPLCAGQGCTSMASPGVWLQAPAGAKQLHNTWNVMAHMVMENEKFTHFQTPCSPIF